MHKFDKLADEKAEMELRAMELKAKLRAAEEKVDVHTAKTQHAEALQKDLENSSLYPSEFSAKLVELSHRLEEATLSQLGRLR